MKTVNVEYLKDFSYCGEGSVMHVMKKGDKQRVKEYLSEQWINNGICKTVSIKKAKSE
jgi:hypothetical protein